MADYHAWRLNAVGKPLERFTAPLPRPGQGEALIRVVGCGVCHTDLGFAREGIPPAKGLPLVLGHEIAGVVEALGPGGPRDVEGKAVVVPAVMPCGACDLCARGRGAICRAQVFIGSHRDGGFATHVTAPAGALCVVDEKRWPREKLAQLAVLADAVSTPYSAVRKSGLAAGDLAIFIGVGGIGGFGAQIAKALGATVVAIDVNAERLALFESLGIDATFNAREHDAKALKKLVRDFAKQAGAPALEWKIFETSGTTAGQQTAFSLLVHGATLMVVGFSPQAATVMLSHLMAFDASAHGVWGCLPELYGEALELILDGKIVLDPFVETRPMDQINEVFDQAASHQLQKRVVLVP